MKRIYLILLILNFQFSILNSLFAQDENAAFYIYQNDGHFDGFFYDEVLKMSYSKIDTAGVEYDVYVTQEIVTADSTYRIMLSAIDSVGFVQPEIKYNPHVYIRQASIDNEVLFEYMYHFDSGGDEEIIVFYRDENSSWLPQPQVGDVFADFDVRDGWSAKIASLTYNYPNYQGYLVGVCKPIDDITDIFQQFVSVEQYGYDDNGQMVRRRVAGRPDLNIGKFPRKASKDSWEGDIFNFSIGGHIPLYSQDDLYVGIDPTIEGKLHIKTVWNLSWFGDKYISIDSRLNFGVGVGFTMDGKIKDFFPSGIGSMASIPVPATFPLFFIDMSPDVFMRGEAHVKFSAQSPRLNGAMWSRLEINNWKPSISVGFGNPDGEKFESVDNGSAGLSLELSGFIQGGMLFPMTFKSLPTIKKLFDASIGGRWFVGPKLSGSIALDLTKMPWDDTASYNQLKNTKLSYHALDADYEVTADVKTLLSGKQNVTLADGSFNLFPPLDAAFAPEFEDCEEYTEERYVNIDGENKRLPCHIFGFKPGGAVVMPIDIATTGPYGTPSINKSKKYYHIHQMMGKPVPKEMYAELLIPYNPGNTIPTESVEGEEIRPLVNLFDYTFYAEPTYKVYHGAQLKASSDTLIVSHDFTPITPITFSGNCDQVVSQKQYSNLCGDNFSSADFYKWLKVSNNEITVDTEQARQLNEYGAGMNYSPVDTLKMTVDPNYWWGSHLVYYGLATVEGELFHTRRHHITVWAMPNTTEDPNVLYSRGVYDNIQCERNGNTWSCSATWEGDDHSLVPDYVPVSIPGQISKISHKHTTSMSFGKELGQPWNFGGGHDVLITYIKYEAKDSEGNFIRDKNGDIVVRSVTVTETTTMEPYTSDNGYLGGRYKSHYINFNPPAHRTLKAEWSTGTIDTKTYDETPSIKVGWKEQEESE